MNSREKGAQAEVWMPVNEYEGLYEVSNTGKVRGLKSGKILKPFIDPSGYVVVKLYNRCAFKNFKVHRLVATAFIENAENKRTVNHKDGNKKNNCVDNLEWMTLSENHHHAFVTGLKKVSDKQRQVASKTGKRTCDQNRPRKAVIMVRDALEIRFKSAHDGARYVEGDASPIIRCCKGKKKTYRGARWRYAD